MSSNQKLYHLPTDTQKVKTTLKKSNVYANHDFTSILIATKEIYSFLFLKLPKTIFNKIFLIVKHFRFHTPKIVCSLVVCWRHTYTSVCLCICDDKQLDYILINLNFDDHDLRNPFIQRNRIIKIWNGILYLHKKFLFSYILTSILVDHNIHIFLSDRQHCRLCGNIQRRQNGTLQHIWDN